MEFKRGNPSALEGRVAIYAENLSPQLDDGKYQIIYGAVNPLDMFFFAQGDVSAELEEVKKEVLSSHEKSVMENQSVAESSGLFTPFAAVEIDGISPEELFMVPGDILFAGRADGKILSNKLLEHSLGWYSINYNAQIFASLGKARADSPNKQANPVEIFRNYNPDSLKTRLYQLVGGLCHAVETDNPGLMADAILPIREISQGSPFARELTEMSEVLVSTHPKRTDIAGAYIELIHAVQLEHYEVAAQIKKKIKAITEPDK